MNSNYDRRKLLVTEIVENPLPDSSVLDELEKFGWDCEHELVIITKQHIYAVLYAFAKKLLTAQQVIDWANRIEGRDDIGYECGGEDVVNEAIFWLANPYLNYPIDEKIQERIEALFDKP